MQNKSILKIILTLITLVTLGVIILFEVSTVWSDQSSKSEEVNIEKPEPLIAKNDEEIVKPENKEESRPVEVPQTDKQKSVLDLPIPKPEVKAIPTKPIQQEPSNQIELPAPLPNSKTIEFQPDISRESMEDKASKKIEDELGKEKTFENINTSAELKVLSKVYPKDIVDELISEGIIKERAALKSGNAIVSITVGNDGRVKDVKIIRGGSGESRNNVNTLLEAAAKRWTFEPFVDNYTNAQEIATQIEFKPEDF